MKNIIIASICAVFIIQLTACDSFLESDMEQVVDTENAFETVQDVQNGITGAYSVFANYRFYGRDVVAIGDIASDNGYPSYRYGYFIDLNSYNVNEADPELRDMWNYGYKVIDAATRTINGANKVKNEVALNASELSIINSCIAQGYALRALASFYLVNLFGLPYGTDNSAHGGLILVDEQPIVPFQKISRASVAQTYTQILADIDRAESSYTEVSSEPNAFYMNSAGINALKAKVALYMKNYPDAVNFAQKAIDLKASGDVSNEMYFNMWKSTAISDEDIFTLSKSPEDNLSANSLNTLYGSYAAGVTIDLAHVFELNDIRLQLIDTINGIGFKYPGIPDNAAVNNIPVFRKSEMYLIIAEAQAQQNQIALSQNALFYTAKRNTDITASTDLPSTKDSLLAFISDERRRELFQEGDRWFNARRLGELITVGDGSFHNYDVGKFVYPIPADEINSGAGAEQNENWSDNLPEE